MKQLNRRKQYGKVRALFGAAALFLLLGGILPVQAAEKAAKKDITPKYLANRDEWEGQKGHHLGEVAKTTKCIHTIDESVTIVCDLEGLKHTKKEIEGAVKREGENTAILSKLNWTLKFSTEEPPGLAAEQVGNVVCKVDVERGPKGQLLAGPYWCPDGYAAYNYRRLYYSYCEKTDRFYFVGADHRWLGCARGDVGWNEHHPKTYTHTLYKYYIEPNTYKVVFNKNGGSGTMSDQSMTYGTAEKLNANWFTRTGYHFTGWKDKDENVYTDGESVRNLTDKDKGTVTLYAQWEANSLKLCYHANDGTAKSGYTLSGQIVQKDGKTLEKTIKYTTKTMDLTNVGTLLTRSGYQVDGEKAWRIGSTSGTAVSQNKDTAVPTELKNILKTKDGQVVTLYANWKNNPHNLTVKPNGGTWNDSAADQTFVMEQGEQKSIPDPVWKGHKYAWTLSGTGSSLSGQTFTMGTENAVLTAQWTAYGYSIHFDGNGATEGTMTDIQSEYGRDITLPENAFKRTLEQGDSLFLGWDRNPEVHEPEFTDKEIIKNLSEENGAVVILYAVWDDCPQIEAYDRYFTLDFAQAGKITEEELLSTAKAVDREDKELENRTGSEIEENGINGSLSLCGYAATDFTGMTDSGSVSMTYKAADSAGNTVYETVTVFITNTDPLPQTEFRYTRFINEKYYGASYENGGLHTESVWRKDPAYRQALQRAFANLKNNTPEVTYRFSHEEVLEEKEHQNTWVW